MGPLLIIGAIAAAVTVAAVAASSTSKPTSTGGGPVGGNTPNPFPSTNLPPGVVDCDVELGKLPPEWKTAITTASATGGASALGQVADQLQAAGFHSQAECVRALTKESSGPPAAKTCDAYLNDLPEPARGAVKDILAKGDPTAIIVAAQTLDGQGYHDAAQCLKDAASKGILPLAG